MVARRSFQTWMPAYTLGPRCQKESRRVLQRTQMTSRPQAWLRTARAQNIDLSTYLPRQPQLDRAHPLPHDAQNALACPPNLASPLGPARRIPQENLNRQST